MVTVSVVLFHHSLPEISKLLGQLLLSDIYQIFIIDNSSNDELRELEKISNNIKYVHNANLGYGAGHNIAIRRAIALNGDYHIVINPDIFFEKGVIEKLTEYMDKNIFVGQVMPQILYPDGKIQYLCKLLPTPMNLLERRFFSCKKYIERRNEKYELRFTGYDKEMEVPSLSGCFMFMRVSVLKQVGGFDERFFMYAEDLDLCRRIGKVAKTIYFPAVQVYHEYAKGSYRNKKLLRYHICSTIKYFNKWGWFFDSERKKINHYILEKCKN